MNDDYIKRQDAIDTHCAICPDKDKCPDKDFICPDRELFRMIKPVYPEPPKIGKWGNRNLRDTELGMATYTDDCSVCKLPAIRLIEGDGWEWEFFYQFCPNCGAKMEG